MMFIILSLPFFFFWRFIIQLLKPAKALKEGWEYVLRTDLQVLVLGGDFFVGALCCGQCSVVLGVCWQHACVEQEWGSRALAASRVY